MKSYVKEFKYIGKDGEIKNRKLFVMRETDVAVGGIELTYLPEDEQKLVLENLKEHEVKEDFHPIEKGTEEKSNYNPTWNKAWRRYNKNKFVVEENI